MPTNLDQLQVQDIAPTVGTQGRQQMEAVNFLKPLDDAAKVGGSLLIADAKARVDADKKQAGIDITNQRIEEAKQDANILAGSVVDDHLENNQLTTTEIWDLQKERTFEERMDLAVQLAPDKTTMARLLKAKSRISFLSRRPDLGEQFSKVDPFSDVDTAELFEADEEATGKEADLIANDIRKRMVTMLGSEWADASTEEVLRGYQESGMQERDAQKQILDDEAKMLENSDKINLASSKKVLDKLFEHDRSSIMSIVSEVRASGGDKGEQLQAALANLRAVRNQARVRAAKLGVDDSVFQQRYGAGFDALEQSITESMDGSIPLQVAQNRLDLLQVEGNFEFRQALTRQGVNPEQLMFSSQMMRGLPFIDQVQGQAALKSAMGVAVGLQLNRDGKTYQPYTGLEGAEAVSAEVAATRSLYGQAYRNWEGMDNDQKDSFALRLAQDLSVADKVEGNDMTEVTDNVIEMLSDPAAIELVQRPAFQANFNPVHKEKINKHIAEATTAASEVLGNKEVEVDIDGDGLPLFIIPANSGLSEQQIITVRDHQHDLRKAIMANAHLEQDTNYINYTSRNLKALVGQ